MMISFKKLSGRRGEGPNDEETEETSTPLKPARDAWSVVSETISVGETVVTALSFHRKGTSVYYLYRHFRDRREADRETMRLTEDLSLDLLEFESKYALDQAA
jgi:hypothetical protein